MGVVVLWPYQTHEGKETIASALDFLHKRILSMGAVSMGTFLVDCETSICAQMHGQSKILHVLHNSESPATSFSIVDNNAGKLIPLVADHLFDLLIGKITQMTTAKKQSKLESKGARFEYGDFLIKVGTVTMNDTTVKGILIEIEYTPCLVLSNCWEMMRETLQAFLGQAIPKEYPAYFSQTQGMHAKHNEPYEPLDTIYQYLEHLNNYRKQIAPRTAMQTLNAPQQTASGGAVGAASSVAGNAMTTAAAAGAGAVVSFKTE